MVKHILIPYTGFHISFEHAKEIDWKDARALLNCDLIEISQARWDGRNYEMLVDEEYLYKKKSFINNKATAAYQQYWTNQETQNPGTIDMNRVNNTNVFGHVLLIKKNI